MASLRFLFLTIWSNCIVFIIVSGLLCCPALAQQYGVKGPTSKVALHLSVEDRYRIATAENLRAAAQAASRCRRADYEAIVDQLMKRIQLGNNSLAETTETVQEMSLRLTEITEEFRQFVPDSANKEVVDTALGKFKDAVRDVITESAELTKTAPLVGNVVSAYETLQKAAKRVDDINKLGEIMGRIQAQYQQIIKTACSAAKWKSLNDYMVRVLGDISTMTVRTDCTNKYILIASDSPKQCTHRDGNPISTPLADPSDTDDGGEPRDTPTPDDSENGKDPRDVKVDPCSELVFLQAEYNRAKSRLERITQNPPSEDKGQVLLDKISHEKAVNQVEKIGERIKELEKLCLEEDEGSDPRDVSGGGLITTPRQDKGEEDDKDPRDTPVTTYGVKATGSAIAAGATAAAMAGQQIKLFSDSTTNVDLPGNGVAKPQTDHDQDPIQGVTDEQGKLTLAVPATTIGTGIGAARQNYEVRVDTTPETSILVAVEPARIRGFEDFISDSFNILQQSFTVLKIPKWAEKEMISYLIEWGLQYETNYCREKEEIASDPLYQSKGAWQQRHDNQWAIKRVGLTAGRESAWNNLGKQPKPVVVAVIDSGLDWNHLDIDWKNLWRNAKEIPDNGVDDDQNGYVDDIIGWDFYGRHNKPWDHDGHGTVVAGIIAAAHNNKVGIAGINPHARIMVLKALNSFGHSRASYLAKAIVYAVDNGARIINMSVGGKNITTAEKEAVKYAISKGVLVVVASGNKGIDVKDYGIAGLESVLTVGATDLKDKRAVFSNWGAQIDIAAPGIDVLSLRARRTDTMRDIPGVKYVNGANYVGKDKRYYRASGTSFAAPIVTGVASLVLSKHPELSGAEVAQILKQTADDVDIPGIDQYSGYGIVNAGKALEAKAGFFVTAHIAGVQVAKGKKGPVVQVLGTANADQFKKATISIGAGENPANWKTIDKVKKPVKDGLLGVIKANELRKSKIWIIRLTVEHKNGKTQEFRFRLSLG